MEGTTMANTAKEYGYSAWKAIEDERAALIREVRVETPVEPVFPTWVGEMGDTLTSAMKRIGVTTPTIVFLKGKILLPAGVLEDLSQVFPEIVSKYNLRHEEGANGFNNPWHQFEKVAMETVRYSKPQ